MRLGLCYYRDVFRTLFTTETGFGLCLLQGTGYDSAYYRGAEDSAYFRDAVRTLLTTGTLLGLLITGTRLGLCLLQGRGLCFYTLVLQISIM